MQLVNISEYKIIHVHVEMLSANFDDPNFLCWHTSNFKESDSFQNNFEMSVKKHICDKCNFKR